MRGPRNDRTTRATVVRGRYAVIAAVLLAALVAACGPDDPEDQLADAFRGTLDSSFSYEVGLEGGDDAGGDQIASALRGLAATGVWVDESWSAQARVLGFDVFELRSEHPERRHLRLGIADVLSIVGGPDADPSAAIVQELEARGHDEETVEVARTALRGGWITVEGPLDAEDLDRAIGVEGPAGERPDTAAVLEALGGDLRGFVDDYVEVLDVEEAGGTQVFEVRIQVREAVRSLSRIGPEEPEDHDLDQLPERLPGTVTVTDGVVREIVVGMGDPEGDASRTRVRVEISDHGDVTAVEPPEDAHRVTSERFLVVLEAFSEIFAETDPLPFP